MIIELYADQQAHWTSVSETITNLGGTTVCQRDLGRNDYQTLMALDSQWASIFDAHSQADALVWGNPLNTETVYRVVTTLCPQGWPRR